MTFISMIFLTSILSGCDVFYDVRYVPISSASATLTAPSGVSTTTLVSDLKKFAQKYDLKCTDQVRANQIYGCYADSISSKIGGGFWIEVDDGRPFIHYFGAHSDRLDFFGKTRYCDNVAKLKTLLEEYVGPLKMEVSNGTGNYNFCSA